MITQFCPLCGPKAKKKELYSQNFKFSQINPQVFSARRSPDRLHYRIVQCHQCGLVFSDPILAPAKISHLYNQSFFTYKNRIKDLTLTYGYYLKQLEKYGVKKAKLLEIGCGNGFFLAEAKKQGYQSVWGVEPSQDAIEQASKKLQSFIRHSVFKPKLFPRNYFDVICFFQTFDHISQPNQFLTICNDYLRPGGLILAINHNVEAFQAKILRSFSPIIDIEHTYLYSLVTMPLIFQANKFQVLKSGPIFNYLPFNFVKLKLWLGNLMLVAQKPYEPIS